MTMVIVGQGPVGLALALFALRAGVSRADISFESPLADPANLNDSLARRQLALSLGSWQLLSRIARPPVAAPITNIEISLQGSAGKTHLSAAARGVEALGYVCDYRSLVGALLTAWQAAGSDGPRRKDPTVIVHAEGHAGEDAQVRTFDQQAVQATLHCPYQPSGLALERFTAQGPAALLPLAQQHCFSLVWCGSAVESERRLRASAAEFTAELHALFGKRLRSAALLDDRLTTPLQRRKRRVTHDGLEVWIGNAAQTLHPVAGQGLNLGLRDAFELAACLGACARSEAAMDRDTVSGSVALHRAQADSGSAAWSLALADFTKRRSSDRAVTIGLTDTLASIFSATPMAGLQSAALTAIDLAPGLKGVIGERFMYGG